MVHIRRGATTERTRPAVCGGARNAQFVATRTQRSGSRLRACQKYFFDKLRKRAVRLFLPLSPRPLLLLRVLLLLCNLLEQNFLRVAAGARNRAVFKRIGQLRIAQRLQIAAAAAGLAELEIVLPRGGFVLGVLLLKFHCAHRGERIADIVERIEIDVQLVILRHRPSGRSGAHHCHVFLPVVDCRTHARKARPDQDQIRLGRVSSFVEMPFGLQRYTIAINVYGLGCLEYAISFWVAQ